MFMAFNPEIHFTSGNNGCYRNITAVCMLVVAYLPNKLCLSIHVEAVMWVCSRNLPVPAPAAAYILRDIPIYGKIKASCTPTGAALLKHFATRFGDMPIIKRSPSVTAWGKRFCCCKLCSRFARKIYDTDNIGDTVVELFAILMT